MACHQAIESTLQRHPSVIGVAQSDRAAGFYPAGCGIEAHPRRHLPPATTHAAKAQLDEQPGPNGQVGGSSPPRGAIVTLSVRR